MIETEIVVELVCCGTTQTLLGREPEYKANCGTSIAATPILESAQTGFAECILE